MFVIKPKEPEFWKLALFLLSHYCVGMETFSDAENFDSTYMVVRRLKNRPDDLRLAEMAFQMNWHQGNESKCEHCSNEEGDTCGHLTFTAPIIPAF